MEDKIVNQITDDVIKGVAGTVEETVKSVVDSKLENTQEEIKSVKETLSEMKLLSKVNNVSKEEKLYRQQEFVVNVFKQVALNKVSFDEAKSIVTKTMTEGTSGDGAELVFDQFEQEVQRVINEYPVVNDVRRLTIIKGDILKLPKAVNGITAAIVGEGATTSASQPTTSFVNIDIIKVMALTKVTKELMDDTMTIPDLFALLVEFFGESIAELYENQILNGDGTGSNFDGIFNNSSVNVVTMSTGDTSSSDINDTYLVQVLTTAGKKFKRNRSDVKWYMSQYVYGIIMALRTTDGSPLYPELRQSEPKLMGYDVVISDKAPIQNVGEDAVSTKFLAFGSLKYGTIVSRKGLEVVQGTTQDDFEKDLITLKATQRAGFELVFPDALTVLKTAAS